MVQTGKHEVQTVIWLSVKDMVSYMDLEPKLNEFIVSNFQKV